jgi:metal-responsive CopG/Arc/MetJ family transcriptional regulator
MSRCHGQLPISTKVDQEMLDYIDQSAEEAGVSRSEFIRRMLDGYRLAEEAGECPECGTNLEFES